MVITQTPFRMSFFGGGTDFEGYFKECSGAVLSTTFDKYCYVSTRHLPPFFEYRDELIYSKIERVGKSDDLQHPAVRNAYRLLDMHELRVTYDADLPARTGLGTSSSFAVGMLNAFHCLKGKTVDKRRLADEAIYLERVMCREEGGIQDQIAAAFGGMNIIRFKEGSEQTLSLPDAQYLQSDVHGKANFLKNGVIYPDIIGNSESVYTVEPVNISKERKNALNDRLMLFFTGFSRFSSDIQKNTKKSMDDKKNELREMTQLVFIAKDILEKKGCSENNLDEFGRLLDHTWKLKRGMAGGISTDSIDAMYKKGCDAGALGGKLLGAGGGGFLLFYVEPEKQENVRNAMEDLMYIPFRFEEKGTQIVHAEAEDY